MKAKKHLGAAVAGGAAGAVNGLFGAGGGMILVPLLTALTDLSEEQIFPTSVSIIFPVCLVSLAVYTQYSGIPYHEAWPYLVGGLIGGLLSGILSNKIPVKWLHRLLGILILWGGVRYLC